MTVSCQGLGSAVPAHAKASLGKERWLLLTVTENMAWLSARLICDTGWRDSVPLLGVWRCHLFLVPWGGRELPFCAVGASRLTLHWLNTVWLSCLYFILPLWCYWSYISFYILLFRIIWNSTWCIIVPWSFWSHHFHKYTIGDGKAKKSSYSHF